MPVPFLPTEIVAEIVSHLRHPSRQTRKDNTANGKSVSLVCRRFVPLGQALRWRSLKIDKYSISSLARHFQHFPHLAKLVRQLDHYYCTDMEEEEEDKEDTAFETESLDELIEILRLTSALTGLTFQARLRENLNSTFLTMVKTIGALPRLWRWELNIQGRIEWTLEVARAFDAGFPALDILVAEFVDLVIPAGSLDAAYPSTSPKKLSTLSAQAFGTSDIDMSRFCAYLVAQLDPCRYTFYGHLSQTLDYNFLTTCSRLTSLELKWYPDHFTDSLSALVQNLPRLRSLTRVVVQIDEPPTSYFLVDESSVSLLRLLAALPASVTEGIFALWFNDYESIPPRPIPNPLHPNSTRLCAVRPLGDGKYRYFTAWKDENVESGAVSWYRSEIDGESW
ncbi:uncharacterized protein JCM6883_003797 [Sporobolomyces salmoneus]|uniref:uncharacterized protein n=1 Tax=Sporobolomyces salmoneus TaxID=183962 RepID=UPI00316CA8ED